MSYTRLRPGFTLTQDRLAELQAVLPEAFADGRINWDVLKETLDPFLEEEGPGAEHYGLFWPGKREARRLAAMPSRGALHPAPGEGVNEDTTRNIFIEGDNLEVLKLLLKSYAGRVKAVYADPPYNTGNDLIYNDDFSEQAESYLLRTQQIDDKGAMLTSNTRASGRFHSRWLSMMYPRLVLARTLLSDDGLLFVSIDDIEAAHLRNLLDEIFGEENFIECLIWKKRYGGGSKERYIVSLHEYVMCYAKNASLIRDILVPPDPEAAAKYYKYRDEKYETRGPYRTHPLEATKSVGVRENLIYPIPAPDGTPVWPKRQWWWAKERAMQALANNELVFVGSGDNMTVHTKQYLKDENGQERWRKPFSIIDDVYTQHGTAEIEAIFGDSRFFSFPKPTGLIKQLLQVANLGDGDIVMDLFAGSASTAQALMEMNRDDHHERKFVMIQVPEPTPQQSPAWEAGFKTISAIGEERIRRVAQKMQAENASRLLDDRETPQDLGFKVFKLAQSDVKPWRDYDGTDLSALEDLFSKAEMPLVDGWSRQHILTEVMLLDGFPLDSTIARDERFTANDVTRVTSDTRAHALYVCLDERIADETVQQLEPERNDVFVCLDSALSDELKMRLADVCNLQTI